MKWTVVDIVWGASEFFTFLFAMPWVSLIKPTEWQWDPVGGLLVRDMGASFCVFLFHGESFASPWSPVKRNYLARDPQK